VGVDGEGRLEEVERRGLPTIGGTVVTTAILEGGRRSLDEGRGVRIGMGEGGWEIE